MRKRISMETVAALTVGETMWDAVVKGFGAKRNGDGSVTFFVKTRIEGRQRWLTIGKLESPWRPESARKEAQTLIGKGYRGEDAGKERKAARLRGKTLGEVLDLYVEGHVSGLKHATRESYTRIIEKRLKPALGHKDIDTVAVEDVRRFHKGLREAPRLANLSVAVLAGAFTWARENGYCDRALKPTEGLELYEENERERYLEAQEAERLAQVLHQAGRDKSVNPFIIAQIWSIIFLGARKSEVRYLRWDYLDKGRKAFYVPDSKTGKRRIPLNSFALGVFERVPRINGSPYIFPNGAGNPQEIPHKVWKRLREAAGLDDVRLHDLRHSFGAVAMDVDGSLPALGKVIGHRKARSTKRYGHVRPSRADTLSEETARQIARNMRLGEERPPSKLRWRLRPRRTRTTQVAAE